MVLSPKKAKGTDVACFVHIAQVKQNFILAHIVGSLSLLLTFSCHLLDSQEGLVCY